MEIVPVATPVMFDVAATNLLLERTCGWSIEDAEIDLVAGTVRIFAKRVDGRRVFFHGDHRHAILDRFVPDREQRPNLLALRPCDRRPADSWVDVDRFIGRRRFEGARSGLRGLARYLVDNAADGFPGLPGPEARDCFRGVAGALSDVRP